jgi:hypothetical protein
VEGKDNYEGLQQFLNCTFKLTRENRLRRFLYQASKASVTADQTAGAKFPFRDSDIESIPSCGSPSAFGGGRPGNQY